MSTAAAPRWAPLALVAVAALLLLAAPCARAAVCTYCYVDGSRFSCREGEDGPTECPYGDGSIELKPCGNYASVYASHRCGSGCPNYVEVRGRSLNLETEGDCPASDSLAECEVVAGPPC